MKNDSQQEERLAWRLKEKQILYDERWLHLESRSYQLADGTVIEPYYVTCPNDFTVIVAVTENGSFLIERLYRPGAEMIMTEPPAGLLSREKNRWRQPEGSFGRRQDTRQSPWNFSVK